MRKKKVITLNIKMWVVNRPNAAEYVLYSIRY